jgi:DNA-binding transcriptional ArsR family regulator
MALALDTAAHSLESLGNPLRLSIYRLLVRAGPEGLPVGKIQAQLKVPGSTLSHHIAQLVQRGMIEQHREGRSLRCVPNFERMNALIEFLTEECCQGWSSKGTTDEN